jgi:hypothetical protein
MIRCELHLEKTRHWLSSGWPLRQCYQRRIESVCRGSQSQPMRGSKPRGGALVRRIAAAGARRACGSLSVQESLARISAHRRGVEAHPITEAQNEALKLHKEKESALLEGKDEELVREAPRSFQGQGRGRGSGGRYCGCQGGGAQSHVLVSWAGTWVGLSSM